MNTSPESESPKPTILVADDTPVNVAVLGDSLHEATETRVRRTVHRESGVRVMLKTPVAAMPSARVVGCLAHEYQVLMQLSAVPGVVRAHALEQHDGTVARALDERTDLYSLGVLSRARSSEVLARRGAAEVRRCHRLAVNCSF